MKTFIPFLLLAIVGCQTAPQEGQVWPHVMVVFTIEPTETFESSDLISRVTQILGSEKVTHDTHREPLQSVGTYYFSLELTSGTVIDLIIVPQLGIVRFEFPTSTTSEEDEAFLSGFKQDLQKTYPSVQIEQTIDMNDGRIWGAVPNKPWEVTLNSAPPL